jgi:hypothetical protein
MEIYYDGKGTKEVHMQQQVATDRFNQLNNQLRNVLERALVEN